MYRNDIGKYKNSLVLTESNLSALNPHNVIRGNLLNSAIRSRLREYFLYSGFIRKLKQIT